MFMIVIYLRMSLNSALVASYLADLLGFVSQPNLPGSQRHSKSEKGVDYFIQYVHYTPIFSYVLDFFIHKNQSLIIPSQIKIKI